MRAYRRRQLLLPLLLVASAACGGTTGPETSTLALEARPADEQRRVVEEDPRSLDWAVFNGSIRISARGASGWQGTLLLRALRVDPGGIVERSTARSVPVTGAELADGASVTDLLATPLWPPSATWTPLERWRPLSVWTPGRALDGSVGAVRDAALGAVGERETAVVVWAMPAAGTAPGRTVTSRPFAVILERKR